MTEPPRGCRQPGWPRRSPLLIGNIVNEIPDERSTQMSFEVSALLALEIMDSRGDNR